MEGKDAMKKNSAAFQPIKILKRQPNSDPCLVEAPNRLGTGPNPRIKTLEEREAAYAEARLRILGPSSQDDCGPLTNGHAGHKSRHSGGAKFSVEPNIKIISNAVRPNHNGKT